MAEKTYIQIGDKIVDADIVPSTPDRKFRDAWKLDGRIVVLDETKLPQIKVRLKKAVDDAAELERLKYITPGAGQAMIYQQKLQEALAVLGGETDQAQVPVLAASVGIEAPTLTECAELVIATWTQWRGIAKQIEIVRLTAKKAINDANTIEDADAAHLAVQWPTF